MTRAPSYVILGRGRWAHRMYPIIAREGRSVTCIEETRQSPSESQSTYVSRLVEAMKASAAQIAWLCVLPGPHVTLMIQAALEARLHVIVEKPWYGSAEATRRLQDLSRARCRLLAVHFEYLLHQDVENWKERFHPGAGLRFGAHFFLNRPDHSGIPAIDNLGCHLLAIRQFAVPAADISEIQCFYERPDKRLVWLEQDGRRMSSINLLANSQRIIQEFIKKVEAALDSAAFPFDLDFALRVTNGLNAYKASRSK